jgi:hypothetical protein
MLPSHEKCPVCDITLKHNPRINRPAPIINQTKPGFYVESNCNNDMTFHLFFQLSSKEGELLVEKITFPQLGREIEVNYTLNKTVLIYWCLPRFDPQTKKWVHGEPTRVEIKDNLVSLDYPTLDKAVKKIKTLALFL